MESNVQALINKVLDSDYRVMVAVAPSHIRFPAMCTRIDAVITKGIITHLEATQLKHEISNYMEELRIDGDLSPFLGPRLKAHGLPSTALDRLAIYEDWENRPRINKELL